MAKTLLLADDSVTIQKVVGITFANEDVELVTAPNGDDALRKVKELKPALVMADIGMPGLDGYELCAAIRAEPQIAHTPVLLLTGTFETYDEQRAAEVGASAYIAKPFEAQALIDQVYSLLERATHAPEASTPAEGLAADEVASTLGSPAADLADPVGKGSHELPDAEAPDLLAGSFGGPASTGSPSRAGKQSELTFEDIDLQDASPDAGANTQIFGMGPASSPDSTSPLDADGPGEALSVNPNATAVWSADASLPPATAPELDAAPAGAVVGDEPVAETVDTEHDIDPNETAFLDPLAEAPTRPDPHAANPNAAEGATFADWSRPGLRPETSDGGLVEDPELLPEAEPLDASPYDAAPPIRSGAPGTSAGSVPTIDRESVSSAVEKVAWEAFGNLSEQLVREVVKKVEAIAWEVVPQLAERMIQDEIEKLKKRD